MSEFNFKSSVCTTREQSERLLALGLKKETADMSWIFSYHWECYVGNPEELYIPDEDGCDDVYIPAWSLGRLNELKSVYEKGLNAEPRNHERDIQLFTKIALINRIIVELEEE